MNMYKVWSGDRVVRKCVMAQGYMDILEKGKCASKIESIALYIKPMAGCQQISSSRYMWVWIGHLFAIWNDQITCFDTKVTVKSLM